MADTLDYLRRLLAEILSQTFKQGREQFFPLGIALTTLVLQVYFRTSMSTDFHGNMLATVWPYVIAFAAYILAQIVRAPLALDRQRAKQIQDLDVQVVKKPEITFEELRFQHPMPNSRYVNILVRMSIRTGESPATLSGWALRSQMKPELKLLAVHLIGLGKHVGGFSTRLESHDSSSGHITFDLIGPAQASEDELKDPRNQWKLEFSDAHNKYSERIPDSLYAPNPATGTMAV